MIFRGTGSRVLAMMLARMARKDGSHYLLVALTGEDVVKLAHAGMNEFDLSVEAIKDVSQLVLVLLPTEADIRVGLPASIPDIAMGESWSVDGGLKKGG